LLHALERSHLVFVNYWKWNLGFFCCILLFFRLSFCRTAFLG